jgi:hypothetical protein
MPTSRKKPQKPRRSAFVPRLAIRAAVAVVPACAAAAMSCGGRSESPAATTDSGTDALYFTVAAVAYPAYEAGSDVFIGVAAVAYPAYESGAPETGTDDAGLDSGPDVFLGVAAVAYPAYEAGPG